MIALEFLINILETHCLVWKLLNPSVSYISLILLTYTAIASLTRDYVMVLPLTLGTIIGPSPPPPALTITWLLADVPKLEAAF